MHVKLSFKWWNKLSMHLKSVKHPIEIIDTLLISWKYLWLFGMTDWRENIPENPTFPMLW